MSNMIIKMIIIQYHQQTKTMINNSQSHRHDDVSPTSHNSIQFKQKQCLIKKQLRKIKIAAISDTHGNQIELQKAVDNNLSGDIFIHAGDYTTYNKRQHFLQFIQLVSKLKFTHKIVIPGNHQILMDTSLNYYDQRALGIFHVKEDMTRQKQLERMQKQNITYLEHEYVQIDGIRILASSYTRIPPYYLTAFQISEQKLDQIWKQVPTQIDILITHGPPFQILDQTLSKQNAGSTTITKYLQHTQAKVHIFGHIHEAKGQTVFNNTRLFNVAEKLKIIQIQI